MLEKRSNIKEKEAYIKLSEFLWDELTPCCLYHQGDRPDDRGSKDL
jgi:hypothetical protein